MKNIVVTGSLAYDYIMDYPGAFTDHINPASVHKINVSFLIDKLKKARGGTAGNIAYNLTLLKTSSSIIGAVGEDFGEYATFLTSHGIDVKNIKVIKNEFTSLGYVMTDKKDDQIWAFYPGAMNHNHNLRIETVEPKPDFAAITPCGSKALTSFPAECKKLKIPYLFDPSLQITSLTNQEIANGAEGAEIFINNDYEYEMIKKRLNFSDGDFLNKSKIIIITKGEKGSVIKTREKEINIPSVKPTQVNDPTGAGDAYRAGFIAGYIKGANLRTCGQMGATAAAYAIEEYGTQNHTFTIDEFKKRYVQAFQEMLEL